MDSGFTLIEALVAITLMGIVLSALAVITSQWLPAWKTIFERVQRSEALMIVLDRVAADIGAAQFIRVDHGAKVVLFNGSDHAVTFVRSAVGQNGGQGLELVRIGETAALHGPVLARSRVAFTPGTTDVDPVSGAVVLLRPPFRLNFEFAGRDGVWRSDWQNEQTLPSAVMITIPDRGGGQQLVRVSRVRAQQPAPENCRESSCGPDEIAARVASSIYPDGEPPTLEQVQAGASD